MKFRIPLVFSLGILVFLNTVKYCYNENVNKNRTKVATKMVPSVNQSVLRNLHMGSKFLYFAYGSNLLQQRIHINNPSAVRHGIGKLKDYQLDFITYSIRWKGASATIVPKKGGHVWGALWEINMADMENLDNQEGVSDNVYYPLNVKVEPPTGEKLIARVYIQTAKISNIVPLEELPDERKPSAVYINTVIKGAKESGLPEDYQNFLKRVAHNGYTGEVDIGAQLNL